MGDGCKNSEDLCYLWYSSIASSRIMANSDFILECWRPVLQDCNISLKILHSGLITNSSFQSIAKEVLACFANYGIIDHQTILDTLDLQSIEEGHILAMHTGLDFKEPLGLYNNQLNPGGLWDTDSDIYVVDSS
jgi:hypothetical protein